MIESPQPIARYLDRKFSQWLIDNFSAGKNAADRDILRRLAEAVSYAVSIKHTCLDLECYSALQEPVLDQLQPDNVSISRTNQRQDRIRSDNTQHILRCNTGK